jgi:RNA 2',3'-cyclic 3'-phosphodiesterase
MSLRLFAALAIPGDVTEGLMRLMRGVDGASWRPAENLHITLAFYGEVMEPDARDLDSAIEEAASDFAPFDLHLQGAGFFGKEEPTAIWMGVAPTEPLRALAAACARAARRIGAPLEGRKFAPHVTMAYLHGATPAAAQAFAARHALYQSRSWTVDRFALMSSFMRKGGPSLYREEAAYALLG